MEALVEVLQLEDFDLRNSRVRSAARTLKALLEPGRNLSPENEIFITTLAHAFICKTAKSPGGDSLIRALHASTVAFALTSLEKEVNTDSLGAQTRSPSPLALLELLEAATIKEKAEEQSADAHATVSKYTEQQPLFADASNWPAPDTTSDAASLDNTRAPSLASVLCSSIHSKTGSSGRSDSLSSPNQHWLPLAKDLSSATLHYAIVQERLVIRILSICDALLQPLASHSAPPKPDSWQDVRRHLSLASQLMLYLEEVLLLQAPIHIATEVEPWLLLIASQLGPVYKTVLKNFQSPGSIVDNIGEEGPGELLLVNELLGVAETARMSPTVLVNLKTLLAATLVDTIGLLDMPELESLLEPGSAFSDAHESLPSNGEEHLGVVGGLPEVGPSLVSLAVQLIQEVDQELTPFEVRSGDEQKADGESRILSELASTLDEGRVIRHERLQHRLEGFEWTKHHGRGYLLSLILPPAGKWMDNLVAMLLVNPDQEGYAVGGGPNAVYEGLVEDGGAVLARTLSTKSAPPAKEDNLFGDLFQEAVGSRVSEACHRDPPPEASRPPPKDMHSGGWAEAATQVAQFLGGCAFDSRWSFEALKASCSMLRKEHVAAIVMSYVGNAVRGLESGGLGSALHGLVQALTVQEGWQVEKLGLLQELAVQLYAHGARADGLLAILAEWILRKAAVLEGAASERGASAQSAGEKGDMASPGMNLKTLVTTIWEVMFESINLLLGDSVAGLPSVVPADSELSPLEHALKSVPNQRQISVLLLGFHSMEPADRAELLRATVSRLDSAVNKLLSGSSDLDPGVSTVQQLAVSRLVLLVGSLVSHYDAFPSWLPGQVQTLLERASFQLAEVSSKVQPPSFTATVAQQVEATQSMPLDDEVLLRSLFLLGEQDWRADTQPESVEAQSGAFGAHPQLASSILPSLLKLLASPSRQFRTSAELLIDRYSSEVCWRALWLWPLPTSEEAKLDSREKRALRPAWLLSATGLSPGRGPSLDPRFDLLLALSWFEINSATSDTQWESDSLTFSTLAVLQAGLQALREIKEGKAEASARPWSEPFGGWLKSRGSSALLSELCSLLGSALSRYEKLLGVFLEGAYGAEVGQLVMVLLRARLSDRSKYEAALVKAGVSPASVQQVLEGGRSLLDGLSTARQPQGNGLNGESLGGETASGLGLSQLESVPFWEAAVLLPGFPSTVEVASAPVASCQMLISAVLACLDSAISLEDSGESEWSIVEESLSKAALSGLIESDGALVNQIWGRHPFLNVEKEAMRELDHSVKLCQGLLDQRALLLPGTNASSPESPSQSLCLGKHLQTGLEAVIPDTADKLEALLNEPSGQGVRILWRYFSDEGRAESSERTGVAAASAEPASNSHVDKGAVDKELIKGVNGQEALDEEAVCPSSELAAGDPLFPVSGLLANPSTVLDGRLLALMMKLLAPESGGPRSGGSDSKPEGDPAHLRERLASLFAQRIQAGLLAMGESGLATWLQERLLGSMAGGPLTWNAQQSMGARHLLEALVENGRGSTREFQPQLVEALLTRLKPAYATFEAKSVDSYFELIVHLSADHPHLIQRTLEVVLELLDDFALSKPESNSIEQLGHVQKLLGFLGTVFASAVAVPASQQHSFGAAEALFRPGRTSHPDRRERSASRNRAPQMHEAIAESREEGKDDPEREDMEEEEEEEEEDLISFEEEDEEEEVYEGDDGETIEMEEEDGFESGESSSDDEDAKLCTFGASGSNFIEQHWYFCYTCDLIISKGCCSTCARVCHKDHKVVYSKFSRFFCDCGAGGSRSNPCQSLKPRAPRSDTSSSIRGHSAAGGAADRASARGPVPGENASDSESEAWFEPQGVLQSEAFPKLKVDAGVLAMLEEKGLEKTLLKLCDRLADALGLGSSGLGGEEEESSFDFALTEGLKPRNDIVSFIKAYKYGTFETKLKMEYSSAREVKAALSTGAITKSLLSVSKRGKIALGEGDKVTVFEAAVLTAAAAEKGAPKPLSKNAVRFQVLNLEFNPANDAHLVVSGYEDCQVFILNARGEVMDRLALELALEPETFLVQATWVPGSQVELLVVSNRSVKMYDLSKDKISPVYFVTVPQESIKQAVLARDSEGGLCIVVLTQQGVLFSGKLHPREGSEGPITLTERLQLPSDRQWPGSRGCSLSYFPEHRTLVSSYEDGQVVIGRLAGSFAGFEKLCFLSENERSGNLHHWRVVNESSGVYEAANSTWQGAAVAVQLAKGTVGTQPLRQVGGSAALRMEGVATYVPPGAGEKCTLLVLNDDGSLQVFSYAPAEKRVPLGAMKSVSKADGPDRTAAQAAATAPPFPLTFFENTTCITQSVTWGGDLGDTDAIKLSLAAEESFLEGPSARPFKIVVNNPGAENVMVGCRIHVGATGRTNVPSRVRVFERSILLEEGLRRWYDIPFTVIESLTADRSFTLMVESAPGGQLPRIDAIKIYARSKEDFGWRAKAESMRELLQQNRAVPGGGAAAGTPGPEVPGEGSIGQVPVSPVEEGLCAGLEVLALFYSWATAGDTGPASKPVSSPRPSGHDHFEDAVEEQSETLDDVAPPSLDRPVNLSSAGCRSLLEKAFSASEPHPSVQSFAQRVLTSLHPTPSESQRAKDALLMEAFAKSVDPCTRALVQGMRSARTRAAQVFSQHLHWASEIAEQRPEHFAEAMGRQGVGFVDGLLAAFEGCVSKSRLDPNELSALTIDLVEVLCGCAQATTLEQGTLAEGQMGGKTRESVDGQVGRKVEASLGLPEEGATAPAKEGKASANDPSEATSIQPSLEKVPSKDAAQNPVPIGEAAEVDGSSQQAKRIIRHLRDLVFSAQEPVRSAASVALSSYLLQSKVATSATPLQPLVDSGPSQEGEKGVRDLPAVIDGDAAVQFSCDGCSICPIVRRRWHCTQCPDFDLCKKCYEARGNKGFERHLPEHRMVSLPVEDPFAAYPSLPNPLNVAQALAHPLSDSGDESDEAPPSQPIRTAHNRTPESGAPSGDGGVTGLDFPADDLSEEALLRLALELSMQEAQPEVARVASLEGGASATPLGVAANADRPSAAGESLKESEQHLAGEMSLQPDESSGKEGEPVRRGERDGPDRSRSRAQFRTMLLESFAEDVSWMQTCSGLEAVPVLQLLARLASERVPGGTIGLDGFDVRKLVVAMLGELDLGVSLPVESRSEWGEVAILTLKFFAFVLGDWEGADEDPGAHRSADAESHRKHRQNKVGRMTDGLKEELQALLDYLLSILQRLVPEFAKPKREKTGPPDHQGALLHCRHDKTLSSLRPFFPDSYTRAHGRDVFAEFPKLMLGVALDLAEALTESGLKPDKSGLTEKKEDVPKGSWVDVLCSYIYCPQTHFVRDSARHVLLQACGGSKAAYNLARDVWLLGKEIQALQRLSEKSDVFRQSLSHDKSVKLVKCLGVLAESAEKRPGSWQWFCSMEQHADALGFLLRASYFIREEAALQALKLLALAFVAGKEEGHPASARPSAKVLLGDPAELKRFVRFFLLDFGAKAVRAQARALLQNAWLRAESESQRHALLACVVDAVPQLSSYGSNVQEVSGLLKWILRKSAGQGCSPVSGVSAKVLDALRAHNRLLETHPNSRAYSTLQPLIEFDGYYLESEPCTACSNVEVPYSKLKLESIKQETKYTDNRILVRCPSSYTVESFSMNVHDARRSKSVKVLRLYYNNRAATDLSELKSNWGLWKKVKSYHLAPNQGELKAELTAPVTGCNFMFEFAELYENLQASSLEHLQCPRCSRHVTDKHGICPHCHENCFQCRQCRNINYENLDSFLCNECGYSKYGRFEFSVNAKPSFAFDVIESEDDMQKCLAVIEKESENAHKQYQQLVATKKPLLRLISTIGEGLGDQDSPQVSHQVAVPSSTSSTLKVNQSVAVLGVLYGNKCKEAFEQVSRSVQTLHGARKALTAYLERSSSITSTAEADVRPAAPQRPQSRCYGCASTFVSHALEWLHLLADSSEEKQKMVEGGLVQELFESGIHHGSQQVRASTRSLICTLVCDNQAASETLLSLIRQRLIYCLDHPRMTELALQAKNDCQLLKDACALHDSCWEPRLKLSFEILFKGVEVGTDSPPIAENVILPCLRIVAQACQAPLAGPVSEEVESSENKNVQSKQASPRLGGLSQAFGGLSRGSGSQGLGGLAGERRSFADVASGAARQETTSLPRGTSEVAASSPQRPPPTRPAPLVVPSQPQPGPRSARSNKGAPVVTYKEWSTGVVTFDDFTQRHQSESLPEHARPKEAPKSLLRVETSLSKAGSIRSGPEGLARKVLAHWRGARGRREMGVLEKDSWLKGLMLHASSPTIRTEACALVRTLSASGGPARKFRFLNLMTELLTSAMDAGPEAVLEYFDLFGDMLAEEDGRLYLAVKGWLRSACELIVAGVQRVRAQEGNYLMANVNEGFVLQHLIGFLRSFLEVGTIRRRFVKDGLLASVLEALLSLKSLVIQKTKLTTSCAQELGSLLNTLLEAGEDTQRSFVRACMSALEAHTSRRNEVLGGQRAATFIMNQLCDVIQPVRPEPVYLLTLNKAHTQEEFIRGSMTQNPYSSSDIGPLMRDVKNKICTQLEMLGLIEDDFGMELLVAGSIVSLDLSIKQVYEKVWLRTQQAVGVQSLSDCPPMTVTYRLQGLDGEATEPMISEVDDDRGEQQDPEVEFALTGEMESCGGLQLLLKILRESPPGGRGEFEALLKLLGFCCKVRTNRRTLLRLDALHVLLERARAAVSVSSTEQDGTAEALLEIIESLVTEANDIAAGGLEGEVTLGAANKESVTAPRRSWAGEAREEEAVAAVKMFLDKLAYRPSPVQGGRNASDSRGVKQKDVQSQADAVARILPYLTYGEPAAMDCLIGHFVPFLDFREFDRLSADEAGNGARKEEAAEHRQRLESFVKVCESIRLDANGDLLKTLFLERGLVSLALHYLKGAFPPVTSAGAAALEIRSVPEFTKALLLPSVPIALGMLTGLANGHAAIQGLMDREGILPLLHALEGVSSERKEIRAKAEGLLDIVSDEASGGVLGGSVKGLRQATKDELRVRAMKRREAMLKGLGMASAVTSDGAERIVVSAKPKIEGLDDMEEEGEDSLSCMVCREGYKLKPTECLGTYTFSKRVNGGAMLGSRSEYIYTTVSHFNVIHFTCHLEAKRADAKLKAPKKEWEGAALRNSETLTNSIFPIRGPAVSSQNYSRYCDQYWENLSALGRSDGSRFKLLAYDLASLLGRFASGGSFSVDSHGGEKESNSQLLPFMVQMGAYLLEQVGSTQRRALRKSLQAYLGLPESSRTPGVGTPVSGSRRGSFADAASHPPASSTADLSSTPAGSSLPPRSPAPAVARSLDESIHLMLVLSLLLHSPEEWQKHRREFLQRGVHFAYNQTRQSRPLMPVPPSPSPGGSLTDLSSLFTGAPLVVEMQGGGFDAPAAFKAVKPVAILVALADKLQRFFKKAGKGGEGASWAAFSETPSGPGRVVDEEELSFSFSRGSPRPGTPISGGGEGSPLRRGGDSGPQKSPSRRPSGEDSGDHSWELVMKEKLRDIPAMLVFAKEFQEVVEDLHAAEDLMELLDIVDCLGDIYDPAGGGSWEEFLEQSVTGLTPRSSSVS